MDDEFGRQDQSLNVFVVVLVVLEGVYSPDQFHFAGGEDERDLFDCEDKKIKEGNGEVY